MTERQMTKEWWKSVNKNWEALQGLILKYHPRIKERAIQNSKITAPAAQNASDNIMAKMRMEEGTFTRKEAHEIIKTMKKNKDSNLGKLLSDTWFGIPESRPLIDSMGKLWSVFCNLCEEWCFIEESEED